MDDVLTEAREIGKPRFLSFDIDVVDPTLIPGTSTPEAGGLYMREALPLVDYDDGERHMHNLCTLEVRLIERAPKEAEAGEDAAYQSFAAAHPSEIIASPAPPMPVPGKRDASAAALDAGGVQKAPRDLQTASLGGPSRARACPSRRGSRRAAACSRTR